MIREIRLKPYNGDEVALQLVSGRWLYHVEDILKTHVHVYENMSYSISLPDDGSISSASLFLNGELLSTEYSGGSFTIPAETDSRLFRGQLGFAQFTLCVCLDGSDEDEWYYSEFASIMIPASEKNAAVSSMLKYIYEHQDIVLKKRQETYGTGRDVSMSNNDIWSRLLLLEEVADVYGRNYGYFKVNARYRLEQVETVDKVEKLQYVDAKTLAYMSQHPDDLRRSAAGVRYRKNTFLPDRILMQQNKVSYDTYENRIVQRFISWILRDCEELNKRIDSYLNGINVDEEDRNGYIASSSILFMNAREMLNGYKEKIGEITEKLKYQSFAYSQLFRTSEIPRPTQVDPTAVFMNVPQYNQVYSCINRWFGMGEYSFIREQSLLNFFNLPEVYESYVLIRLASYFTDHGYALEETENIEYAWAGGLFHKRDYNNYYCFSRENRKIYLYYEPVIYDEIAAESGLNLYRNNSIRFRGDNGSEQEHCIYTPDYVIKSVDADGREEYIICDAKYSYFTKIRNEIIPELVFKYLFSLSPANSNAKIIGLDVFFGMTDSYSDTLSVYDRKKNTPISPFAEYVPMSELLSDEERNSNLLHVVGSFS